MKKLLIIVFVLLFSGILKAQEKQFIVPYTLADRERAIRIEAKIESVEAKVDAMGAKMDAQESKMNINFESIQIQLNQLRNLFCTGFGILITLYILMMGYMIWNRRICARTLQTNAFPLDQRV